MRKRRTSRDYTKKKKKGETDIKATTFILDNVKVDELREQLKKLNGKIFSLEKKLNFRTKEEDNISPASGDNIFEEKYFASPNFVEDIIRKICYNSYKINKFLIIFLTQIKFLSFVQFLKTNIVCKSVKKKI